MTLVSSFAHTDIDTTKVRPGTGLEFLRNYLQYAASDGKIFANGELSNEPMNDFEVDVHDALTARGMKLVPQVGCSQFRLDFGVCHPTEPGRFILAIECDGATYHSSYTARDRDRLRQQQLENLGWVFHRIWSTDWFMRKNEEVERAWTAYQSAIARGNENRDLSRLPVEQNSHQEASGAFSGPELTSLRSSVFPPIVKRDSITEYQSNELQALYDWVNSDGKLRTHDELADEMFAALPFARRGARIEAALRETIRTCDGSRKPQR
jgi:very-short-patch-repair endonuclease